MGYRLSDSGWEVSMHEVESAACFNQEYEFDDNDKLKIKMKDSNPSVLSRFEFCLACSDSDACP